MMRREVTYGGEPAPPDLSDPEQVRQADMTALALELLRAGWTAEPEGVVWRRELISRFTGGSDPLMQRLMMRRLAEAFMALTQAGAVCEDVEQSSDGFFFAAQFGRYLLQAQAPLDELKRRLGH